MFAQNVFQFYSVGGEFANSVGQTVRRHFVFVHVPTERFFVQFFDRPRFGNDGWKFCDFVFTNKLVTFPNYEILGIQYKIWTSSMSNMRGQMKMWKEVGCSPGVLTKEQPDIPVRLNIA